MAKKIPDKMCQRCRKIKPATEFFANKGWEEQGGRDIYCRECTKELIVSKDTAREYFWENNRLWSDAIWDLAKKRAEYDLFTNQEYLDANTSKKRKREIYEQAVANRIPAVMNQTAVYRYSDNSDEFGNRIPYNPESLAGTVDGTETMKQDDEMVWSDEWGGMYTRRELKYLDDYFARQQEDFVIDNVNREDYARRVAQASLDANNKLQKMRQGTGTAKEWQDAQGVFDSLSKSASFAESQRKEVANSKMDALSQIIMDIELNHHNEMPKVTFPKDDVDKIMHDFGFTAEAIA